MVGVVVEGVERADDVELALVEWEFFGFVLGVGEIGARWKFGHGAVEHAEGRVVDGEMGEWFSLLDEAFGEYAGACAEVEDAVFGMGLAEHFYEFVVGVAQVGAVAAVVVGREAVVKVNRFIGQFHLLFEVQG